jgi:hypothetical protein
MRRTPSFVDKSDDIVFRGVSLRRPNDFIGDFLENRRVLRALHGKLHFPELEGIVDDDEALNAFYAFDGTRFIKDRVLNLFDDSEYSFRSMFMSLVDDAFAALRIKQDIDSSVYDQRLYKFLGGRSLEVEHVLELSGYVNTWGKNIRVLRLVRYSSDFYHTDSWYTDFHLFFKRVASIHNNLLYYSDFNAVLGTKLIWRSVFDRRVSMRMKLINKSLDSLKNTSLVDHLMGLSSCMNLPDDKHAEGNESELVDKWLEMFDSFYPQYERLKAWYIREKESSAGTAA